jgi:hypothetical protein
LIKEKYQSWGVLYKNGEKISDSQVGQFLVNSNGDVYTMEILPTERTQDEHNPYDRVIKKNGEIIDRDSEHYAYFSLLTLSKNGTVLYGKSIPDDPYGISNATFYVIEEGGKVLDNRKYFMADYSAKILED